MISSSLPAEAVRGTYAQLLFALLVAAALAAVPQHSETLWLCQQSALTTQTSTPPATSVPFTPTGTAESTNGHKFSAQALTSTIGSQPHTYSHYPKVPCSPTHPTSPTSNVLPTQPAFDHTPNQPNTTTRGTPTSDWTTPIGPLLHPPLGHTSLSILHTDTRPAGPTPTPTYWALPHYTVLMTTTGQRDAKARLCPRRPSLPPHQPTRSHQRIHTTQRLP